MQAKRFRVLLPDAEFEGAKGESGGGEEGDLGGEGVDTRGSGGGR